MLGKTVNVVIDRPMGSAHPNHSGMIYPVNYGYVPKTTGGDGEAQDAYVLGVDRPIESFTGTVIGVIHRCDDVEDKWVAAPEGKVFTREEIWDAVRFQEQYFDSKLCVLERSCGVIPFSKRDGELRYLLIRSKDGRFCGFPKGHREGDETEEETAIRETVEETSVTPRLIRGFRRELLYPMKNGNAKSVVYFLGEYGEETPKTNEGFEEFDYLQVSLEEALSLLSFENTKEILKEADVFLKTQK